MAFTTIAKRLAVLEAELARAEAVIGPEIISPELRRFLDDLYFQVWGPLYDPDHLPADKIARKNLETVYGPLPNAQL